jgi:hypothetical protein
VTLDLGDDDTSEYSLFSFGQGRDYHLALLAGTEDYVSLGADALTEIPRIVLLDQNAPNPFNPATRIRFGLPRSSRVSLDIYNIRGERVTSLIKGDQLPAGFHTRIWAGRDLRGQRVASGVYIYRLATEGKTVSRKMVLMQ